MSIKIGFFVLTLVGFMFITLYRSMLVAFVAVEHQIAPIKSLDDIGTSDYQIVVEKNTAADNTFLNANPGTVEEKLSKSNKILRLEGLMISIMDQMTSSENEKRNLIFYGIHEDTKFSEHYPCKITKVPHYEHSKYRAGMIFKKNWPFTPLLNYHMLIMKEEGIMDRYFRPYEKKNEKLCDNEVKIRSILKLPQPVSLYTTVFLFLIISSGFLCAIGLLVIEMIENKCIL